MSGPNALDPLSGDYTYTSLPGADGNYLRIHDSHAEYTSTAPAYPGWPASYYDRPAMIASLLVEDLPAGDMAVQMSFPRMTLPDDSNLRYELVCGDVDDGAFVAYVEARHDGWFTFSIVYRKTGQSDSNLAYITHEYSPYSANLHNLRLTVKGTKIGGDWWDASTSLDEDARPELFYDTAAWWVPNTLVPFPTPSQCSFRVRHGDAVWESTNNSWADDFQIWVSGEEEGLPVHSAVKDQSIVLPTSSYEFGDGVPFTQTGNRLVAGAGAVLTNLGNGVLLVGSQLASDATWGLGAWGTCSFGGIS